MTETLDRELVERARRGTSDAASVACEQAMAGLGSLRDPERFGPWLRTIAIRRARATLRSAEPFLEPVELACPANPMEAAERSN